MTLPSPTRPAPYDLHGAALLDCYRGDAAATLTCHQNGGRDDVPAAFWLRDSLDPLEQLALNLCHGRVLDLGAGSGLHALALQQRGLEVVAIDIAPQCVEIMRERGVRDARVADLFAFEAGRFDTIACLCNGLDKVGRLADLPRFLDRMAHLLAPGGQLLADSFDLRVGADPERFAQLAAQQREGRYFGETDLCFEYRGRRSEPFPVLHVDFFTLQDIARARGWACSMLADQGGHYLARLIRR
jgi:SAM-dependent methyltransferase